MSIQNDDRWKKEAEAVIGDIKDHVKSICISPVLESTRSRIYLNLTTLEMAEYCVEMTAAGFQIVGNGYDSMDNRNGETYETMYSLLDQISPGYRNSFGRLLECKLQCLKDLEDEGES